MRLKLRVLVIALLLIVAMAGTARAGFDQAATWHWYSDCTYSTVVGWRYQDCSWAYWWGEETQYEMYDFIYWCE